MFPCCLHQMDNQLKSFTHTHTHTHTRACVCVCVHACMCLSHVCLGIPSLLPLGFVIKILYAHVISPMHAACHTHLILPNWWKSFFHELCIQMRGMPHFRNPWSQINECIRKFIKDLVQFVQNFWMSNTRGIVYHTLFLRSCCRKLWSDAHTRLCVLVSDFQALIMKIGHLGSRLLKVLASTGTWWHIFCVFPYNIQFQIIQSLSIIATLSMLALSHRNSASTWTFHDTCSVRIAIKWEAL